MALLISISPEAEAKLRDRAAAGGELPETVAARLVEEGVRTPSLEEVLAPVWAEFDASGMTDDELTDLLEKARHEMRAQRRANAP